MEIKKVNSDRLVPPSRHRSLHPCGFTIVVFHALAGGFLSYASQDADAARRSCEALHITGIEVWFDQSELRGGDAWDAAIRKQIKDCALFVPVNSANTQTRHKGYFRLEWHLAEQRSHLIARGGPFIVPVAIDETHDTEALVPDAGPADGVGPADGSGRVLLYVARAALVPPR